MVLGPCLAAPITARAGKKEGQHLIVRDSQSNTPMLYQWSTASQTWEKVGEVVGGKGDGSSSATIGKRMFEGQVSRRG